MTRFLTAATMTLALTGASALAMTPVEKVDVEADLTVIENDAAASVWSGLEGDLETALAERLVDQIAEDGATIEVEIDTLELANSFEKQIGIADSEISGDVKIKVPGLANNERYTLTVSSEQAQGYFPDGTVVADLTMGSETYYQAIVAAFAENIAQKLQ
ncbi:hypothetical protein [Tateyamaria sp. SN6-1]|uniref:hypothetical protein n=1 Tax=Tateyamaria sp. SN6-1 TaxID=3092148 RepID=UPI0039F4DA7F